MTVSASLKLQCKVTETLAGVGSAASPQITHDQYGISQTINGGTTVPATKVYADEVSLSAGAKTIDFAAYPGTDGTDDATGLKLQSLYLLNKTGNSAMEFSKGASNGYELGGDASWQVTLKQGQAVQVFGNEQEADVASGAKTIDVAGTGTEAFQIVAVFG